MPYLNLCCKNVYRLFLSETRRVFEEIAVLLPQKKHNKATAEKKHKQIIR